MKTSILLILPLMLIVVLMAGCIGSNTPTPTMTAYVSPTIAPAPTVIAPSVTVLPLPTPVKMDSAITQQVSIVLGRWAQSNFGWDNDTVLRDVTFDHKDGNDYIYTFTANGAFHTARIAYDGSQFTLVNVDNGASE